MVPDSTTSQDEVNTRLLEADKHLYIGRTVPVLVQRRTLHHTVIWTSVSSCPAIPLEELPTTPTTPPLHYQEFVRKIPSRSSSFFRGFLTSSQQ